MSSYVGKHAEYYDIFYQDKPYAQEASFVHGCLKRHAQVECLQLMELACGTGAHAFELEKFGYKILATDYSEDLLKVAKRKAKERKSEVEFEFQDMRALSLGNASFEAIYCLFDSIGYVQTNEAIRKVLDGVRAHLAPLGLFVFEFWHAAAMLRGYEPVRERRWKTASSELVRTSTTRLDVTRQLAEVKYDIVELNDSGQMSRIQETQVNRYFLVQEMAAFLEEADFTPLEFLPAYEHTAITEDTWHILAIARRN